MLSIGPHLEKIFKDTWVNINGTITQASEAKISIFDRGFLFADSVYEVTRTYDQIPHLLEDHLERLRLSAKRLNLPIFLSDETIVQEVYRLLEYIRAPQITIRIIVTRGVGELNLDPSSALGSNNLIIIAKGKSENPNEWYEKGVHLIISSEQRGHDDLAPGIKAGNYLHSMKALQEAKGHGAYDALLLGENGEITEGTTFNIWMIKNQTVYTPPLSTGILEGTTRRALFKMAQDHQFSIIEKVFKTDELFNADEVFLTSSGRELVPVTKIEDHAIGTGNPGFLTLKLLELYRQETKNYIEKQKKGRL